MTLRAQRAFQWTFAGLHLAALLLHFSAAYYHARKAAEV